MILSVSHRPKELGYLAVDMLVAIFTAALFILAFYQIFTVINNAYTNARNQSAASSLAYTYLRAYSASNPPSNWFVCDTTSGTGNTNDVAQNSNAGGQTLKTGSLTPSTVNLPGPTVTYRVTALAVYGCNASNAQKPIRVQADVTYGPDATVMRHTILVGYTG